MRGHWKRVWKDCSIRGIITKNDENLSSFLLYLNWTVTDVIGWVTLFQRAAKFMLLLLTLQRLPSFLPQPTWHFIMWRWICSAGFSVSLWLSLSSLAGCSLYHSVCHYVSLSQLRAGFRCLTLGPAINWLILALPWIFPSLTLSHCFSFLHLPPLFRTLFPISSHSFLQISTTQLSLRCLKAVMILIKPDLQ